MMGNYLKILLTVFLLFEGCSGSETKKDQATNSTKPNLADSVSFFILPETKICGSCPKGWKIDSLEDRGYVCIKNCHRGEEIFCPNFVYEIKKKNYFEEISEEKRLESGLQAQYENYNIVNIKKDSLFGFPCTIMDFIVFKLDHHFGGTCMVLKLKEKSIQIVFLGLNEPKGEYLRTREIFTKTINTLKLRQ